MKTIIDKNYGADADGNRGITVVEYEIENSDRFDIEEQVAELLSGYDVDDYPDTVTVYLYSEYDGEDVPMEVDVGDYL